MKRTGVIDVRYELGDLPLLVVGFELERGEHLIAAIGSVERSGHDDVLDERHVPRPLQHSGDRKAVERGFGRQLVDELDRAIGVGGQAQSIRVAVDRQ